MGSLVAELKEYIDVFMVPSSGDERHQLFPLKPYSDLFFLGSQQEIALCSDPQTLEASNGLRVHLSCGENIRDFAKNSGLPQDELEVMELMLRLGHYCPTAPFSLRTEPFLEDYLTID